MNEALAGVLAGISGAALGVIFFGGLWWTVLRGASSRHAALWFFGSLLLRTSIVVAGFSAVAAAHWERLLLCLVGFTVARLVVTGWTRSRAERRPEPAAKGFHAP